MTINIINRTMGFVFIFLVVFLFGYTGQAQTLGSLYAQEGNEQLYIEEGASLRDALEEVEEYYNVGLLYRSIIVEELTVKQASNLPTNIEGALTFLLKGTDLSFKGLNPKTYGIYKNTVIIPQAMETDIQQHVTGTVVDAETGESLPGVNVIVRGTEIGTATDMDGNYQLSVPSTMTDDGVLVFSSVGFQTVEVPIEGRSAINVSLQMQTLSGGELVVVGYGTQERRQITGSVSSVQEEEFVSGNVKNVSEMIQGKVAGLQISNGESSNPNSTSTLRLRGVSSFGANQEPLVVVDGIIGADINNIDPYDIASVDVLKDASAAAIYGTRGSAGVILITTKSGQAGDEALSVSYNAYTTIETIENKTDVLTADEYRELSQITGWEIQDFGNDTNWFDEISQTGRSNVQSLALSGGTENMNYRLSGNYRDRKGIQKYTGFEQLGGRLNLTHWALEKKLKFTGTLSATSRDRQLGFGDAFRYAQIMNPTAPVRDEDFENLGGYFDQSLFDYFNPVNIIENGERSSEEKDFNLAIRADYEFQDLIPNLSASVFYSLDNRNQIQRNFFNKNHKLNGGATQASLGRGLAQQNLNDWQSELFEVTVNYLADITGRLSFESFAGYSYSETVEEGFSASGGNFITDAVGVNNFQFAQDFNQGTGNVNSFKYTSNIIGYFGRMNLRFDNTYFINASLRREGSSRFGVDNKWGNFWSLGGGIEVSNLVNIGFLDVLRARTSIGKTGQDAPETDIAVQRYAPQANFFANRGFIQSFGPVSNANPDLKWEEKTEINIGLDFEALESRIRGSVEWYNSTTSDLLFLVGVPVPPNLFSQTWRNVGELENSGLELTLAIDAVQSSADGLNWSTQLNFSSFSETMLNKFESDEVRLIASPGAPGFSTTQLIRVKQGEPIGQIWGHEFSRIGSDGQWLFFDKNGNEVPVSEVSEDDKKVLGNGLPDFQLGWSNTLNYRNWDLNLFLRGSFGHQLVNLFGLFYQAPKQITSYNVLESAQDISELRDDPQYSSFNVENADFLRLQNLTIGYTFPFNSNSQIDRLRAYVSANNLFTITGYNGINPEVRHTDDYPNVNTGQQGGALAPGIEREVNWFTTRSFNIGINLDF